MVIPLAVNLGAQGIYGGGRGVDFSVADECMPEVDGIAMARLRGADVGGGDVTAYMAAYESIKENPLPTDSAQGSRASGKISQRTNCRAWRTLRDLRCGCRFLLRRAAAIGGSEWGQIYSADRRR